MARLSASSSLQATANGHAGAGENSKQDKPLREYTDQDFLDFNTKEYEAKTRPLPFDPSLLPRGSRSLSLIGLQAFSLGFTLSTCLVLTAWLIVRGNTLWRLPSFFVALSVFHFFEYWITATYNPSEARSSSFLLYDNGRAYNVAHSLATLEIVVSTFFPSYQTLGVNPYSITIGIGLIVTGQLVRSVAMAQAGTNFNHTPQKVRKEGHVLVTTGVYAWLRHPSYFGFFWWALGTQVLVGNKICLVGYLFALWTFFHGRIIGMLSTSQ